MKWAALITACWCLGACQPKTSAAPGDVGHHQGGEPAAPAHAPRNADEWVPANDPRILIMGRTTTDERGALHFGYPGVTLYVEFEGPELRLKAESNSGKSRLGLRLDGAPLDPLTVPREEQTLVAVQNLAATRHRLEITHLTESWIGIVSVSGISASGGQLLEPSPLPERRLLFIGDSVTCGEAVERSADCDKNPTWWNSSESYGVLTAHALAAQVQLVCYGGRGLIRDWQGKTDVLNAPQFFDLAIPEANHGASWDHTRYPADAIVVSLGTNDFSLGIGPLPERAAFVEAYIDFARRIRQHYPRALIVLTQGGIVNDDNDPQRPQRSTLVEYIRETIERTGDTRLVFWSDAHHPGDRCDAHPTAKGHREMAQALSQFLKARLGW